MSYGTAAITVLARRARRIPILGKILWFAADLVDEVDAEHARAGAGMLPCGTDGCRLHAGHPPPCRGPLER